MATLYSYSFPHYRRISDMHLIKVSLISITTDWADCYKNAPEMSHSEIAALKQTLRQTETKALLKVSCSEFAKCVKDQSDLLKDRMELYKSLHHVQSRMLFLLKRNFGVILNIWNVCHSLCFVQSYKTEQPRALWLCFSKWWVVGALNSSFRPWMPHFKSFQHHSKYLQNFQNSFPIKLATLLMLVMCRCKMS